MEPENLPEVKRAFEYYLSNPLWNWNWVLTQTFDPDKVPMHRNICRDTFRTTMDLISVGAIMAYGFAFGEQHRSGLPHWHAILHVETNLFGAPTRRSIWQRNFSEWGRNRIEPFRARVNFASLDSACVAHGIARYLCKYVAKDSVGDQAWWDFDGNIGGLRVDAARIAHTIGLPEDGLIVDPDGSSTERREHG